MKIYGLQKMTLLDYPGKLAATVFTAGCNFRCPWCHNASLVLNTKLPVLISDADFFAFLEKRRGWLDGICITGGEPLLQKDLPEFIEKIKNMGFLVKLDTNSHRSWVGIWTDPSPVPSPITIPFPTTGTGTWGELAALGFPGTFTVRGKGIPAVDYKINGTVTNATGEPVAAATIAFTPGVRTAKTNASGFYRTMLDSGEYSATVSGFGYQNQTKSVTIPEGVTEPVVLDFQLENLPSITVKGVVTDGGVDEDVILDDINLRLDAACLTFEPQSIKQSQLPDRITEQTLTFTNTGAKEIVFEIRERDLGGPNPFSLKLDDEDLIMDPGFEAYTPNPYRDEFSANFGTPLCTAADCDTGGGSGAHTGLVWSWFGGVRPGDAEQSYLSQNVEIPEGSAIMRFWLEQSACGDSGAASYLALQMDGQEVWRADGTDPSCNKLGYREIEVNVSDFADGNTHEIKFYAETIGEANYFLDDIELIIGSGTGGDILWLDVDIMAEVVMPGQSVDVTLTFDSTDLVIGDYIGELVVNNVPNPRITIPVRLRVQGISDLYLPMIGSSTLYSGE